MPTYARRDDYVINAIGYAIPNTSVTYFVEPGETLATIYADENGVTPAANPQFTDGLGHAVAYLLSGLYTIVYAGRQIQTLTLPNQAVGFGGSGTTVTTFAGIPQGTIDGVNRVFTLTNAGTPLTAAPTQLMVWLNFPLIQNVGYTISGVNITYAVAPQTTDTIWSQGVTTS